MKDDGSQFIRISRPSGPPAGFLTLAAAAWFFAVTGVAHALPTPTTSAVASMSPNYDPLNTVFDPNFAKIGGRPIDNLLIEAAAHFGSVGVEDTVQGGGPGPSGLFGISEAYFSDVLRIFGPPGMGKVSFNVGLHGSAFTTMPGIVDPSLQFGFFANAPNGGTTIGVRSVIDGFPSKTFTSAAFDYTFGDPIAIVFDLTGAITETRPNLSASPPIAELLYVDTATLSGITVFDANGAPVTDFSVASDSGTFYDANGVRRLAPTNSVPEPPALALMAIALVACGCFVRLPQRS